MRSDLRSELEILLQQLGDQYPNLALPEEAARLKRVSIGGNNVDVGPTFRDQVLALFDMQKPPISSEQMAGLIGDCEFEKGKKRAPKNSFSNERSTWLQKLNGIKIKRMGNEPSPLTPDERQAVINLPYEKEKVTYAVIRDVLCQQTGFSRDYREASFNMLSYRPKVKSDAGWISIVEGENIPPTALNKYNNFKTKDELKNARKKLKDALLNTTITYGELRRLFNVPERGMFVYANRSQELIPRELEQTQLILFGEDESQLFKKDITYKLCLQKNNKTKPITNKKVWALIFELKKSKPKATLADLRVIIDGVESIDGAWLFELNRTERITIEPSREDDTRVPIEYENMQSVEDSVCIELKGWHKLRKALHQDCTDFWQSLSIAYQQPAGESARKIAHQLDEIARIVTIYQTDYERRQQLTQLGLDQVVIGNLLKIKMADFRNLSFEALKNILPFLEVGDVFSQACEKAGYNHSQRPAQRRKTTLDPLETYQFERWRSRNDGGKATITKTETRYKDLNNPTVARALNQARRALNALVEEYGSPAYINVELARDLSRSKRLRDKVASEQSARRNENVNADKALKEIFKNEYGINDPSGNQILKYKLYKEQGCQCAYTYPPLPYGLDLDKVIRDSNYTQIDHIWPKSRTFDNSINNRVLVLSGANQNKGDSIPYDFFGKQNPEHWQHFQAWVDSCKGMPKEKQDHLLAKELDAEGHNARNLVDTRYITRLFARMLREKLLFAGGATEDFAEIGADESGKEKLDKFYRSRVRTPQGGVTSFLRRCWGLKKNREESDLHHAMDACMIAAASPSLIKQVNDFNRREEQFPYRYKKNNDGTFTDTKPGEGTVMTKDEALEAGVFFPKPWRYFREEVLARLSSDGKTYQTKKGERKTYDFANYAPDEISQVKPVLVSRMVKRKRNVELHDANPTAHRYFSVKLIDLNQDIFDALPKNLAPKRKQLLDQLQTKLQQHNGNAAEAFADDFMVSGLSGNEYKINAVSIPLLALPAAFIKAQEKTTRDFVKRSQEKNFAAFDYEKIALKELTLSKLDEGNLEPDFYSRNKSLVHQLQDRLKKYNDNAKLAFAAPFFPSYIDKQTGLEKISLSPIHSIRLTVRKTEKFSDTSIKNVPLNKLSLKMLTENELGSTFYHRNIRLIDALRTQLVESDGDAEKAFDSEKYFYPFGENKPFVKSVRLPVACNSGIFVRGGIASLKNTLYTEMYKHQDKYYFRSRYKIAEEKTFGLPIKMPKGAQHICNFAKNDFVRVKHPNLIFCYRELSRHKDNYGNTLISVESIFKDGIFEGTWEFFDNKNDRPQVKLHDGRGFFLLGSNKLCDKTLLTLIATDEKETEYREYSNSVIDKPLTFSFVKSISRKVDDAVLIEKLTVSVLGQLQERESRDLA